MRRSSYFTWSITILALSALALGLLSLPDDFSEPIRLSARDVSRPGQTLTRLGVGWGRAGWQSVWDWQARRVELRQLQERLAAELLLKREYQSRLAELRQRVQRLETQVAARVTGTESAPLFIPEFVAARVLGTETVALAADRKLPGRKLLGAGKTHGISENLLVIDPGHPTLDVGTDHGVAIHQPVFAGEVVIGRTAQCGRYSCTLQAVTDAKFQGAAQVLRKTSSGWQTGPQGVLEGTGGDTCRLTGIWHGDDIQVGAEIYTPAADPLLPHPMFYGRVIQAKWKPGTAHWEIEVEPAAKNVRPTFVNVLKPKENVVRITAN